MYTHTHMPSPQEADPGRSVPRLLNWKQISQSFHPCMFWVNLGHRKILRYGNQKWKWLSYLFGPWAGNGRSPALLLLTHIIYLLVQTGPQQFIACVCVCLCVCARWILSHSTGDHIVFKHQITDQQPLRSNIYIWHNQSVTWTGIHTSLQPTLVPSPSSHALKIIQDFHLQP